MSDEANGGMAATASPTTFEEAFASDVSPASGPESSESEQAPPAAAQPETEDTETDSRQPSANDGRERFIPRERFDEVNTQLKDLKAWKEQRAWADQLDQPTAQQMLQFYQQATGDPRAFGLQLLDELIASPEHGQAIRSELARRLAMRKEAGGDGIPEPDVELTDGQGKVIGRTYSDQQLAKRDAVLRQQMKADLLAELAPQLQTVDQLRAAAQAHQEQQQAQQFAQRFSSELEALPGFAELKPAIAKELSEMSLPSDHPSVVEAATYRAYLKLAGGRLNGTAKSDVLADLKRKAAASTVNPSGAAGGTGPPITSFEDPRLNW